LPINLKKLQAVARRRLKLNSPVEWNLVSKTQLKSQGLGEEYLSTRTGIAGHVISYSDASSLEAVDVFHELCRAKLNELGFNTVEAAALNAMRECGKDDPKYIRDANSAAAIVLEALANSILFSLFPEESRTQRERRVLRFESTDALTTLHTQMGFWGTAGVSYHLEASKRSGTPFPEDLIEKAMERASDGQEIRKEYDQVNSLLEELPEIDLGLERLPDEDSVKMIDVMLRLFAAKTGLECE
jgi:hypothetical protein